MESWAEKYRPESLSDIIGNTKVINDLKTWAKSWGDKMVKKGVILSGPPGCGKTSAAIALANDMEWEVIELNASDARSGAVIEGTALRAGLFQTFGSKGLADRNLINPGLGSWLPNIVLFISGMIFLKQSNKKN